MKEILFVGRKRPDEEIRRLLEARGFFLSIKRDVEVTDVKLESPQTTAVVIDLKLGRKAIKLITRIREHKKTRRMPILAIGEWGSGLAVTALSRGADAYEPAPITARRLASSIDRLLAKAPQRAIVAGMNS